jgi:hypothetical protein
MSPSSDLGDGRPGITGELPSSGLAAGEVYSGSLRYLPNVDLMLDARQEKLHARRMGNPHGAKGLCRSHYAYEINKRRGKEYVRACVGSHAKDAPKVGTRQGDCKLPGCSSRHYCRGWCKRHYAQHLRGKEPHLTVYDKKETT